MKKETFRSKKVIKRLNNEIVAVKIYKENNKYSKYFNSKFTPTTFFITPNGKNIIRPILGYVNVEYFLSYLDDVKRRKAKYNLK